MSLSAGTKLGSYEILAPIGAGGMGEVYRARDTRLKRDVALKVLPEALAADPGRMARFQREAEVLASLNHPNIAHIFGVEERGLAMELVEGPTLPCPLPLETALAYAKQIAEALEYAHERGVIHRDLKPANIKVTSEGMVKILDFGLAKAAEEPVAESGDASISPTLTLGHTQLGVILGTAAYMAPEQAAGTKVDRRADIWSFGAVLYEILSGKRAFDGNSVADTLATVMKVEPDWSALPKDVPQTIQNLIRRCLTKDRKQRLQAIGEARILLENRGVEEPAAAIVPSGPRPVNWPRLAISLGIASTVLALTLAALAIFHFREAPPDERALATSILPPEGGEFDLVSPAALSPDGTKTVFCARGPNAKTQLWLRTFSTITPQALQGTEGARFPFWSPDSKYIGFFAGGKLKRIEVSGGSTLVLADAPEGFGGSRSQRGVIVFAPLDRGPIRRISALGGSPIDVTKPQAIGSYSHRYPYFLPDGHHFLFQDYLHLGLTEVQLRIAEVDSGELKTIGPADSAAVYANGHLLYLRQGSLVAQSFDEQSFALRGEPLPLVTPVRSLYDLGSTGAFSVSKNGTLLYQGGETNSSHELIWYDRGGRMLSTLGAPSRFNGINLSPDGRTLAAAQIPGDKDLWLYDVARGSSTRFTFTPSADRGAIWSPDGKIIVYASARPDGVSEIRRKSVDGSGNDDVLYSDAATMVPSSWSPDGKFIMFHRIDPKAQHDIWILPLGDKAAKPYVWLATPFDESDPMFSPDGKWVAYHSVESGRNEVYIAGFPGPGGKRQVSTEGGSQPRWRADGKEIFFVSNNALHAVPVTIKADGVEIGAPHSLGIRLDTFLLPNYDVSPDGQRIVAASPIEHESAAPLTLVQSWTALLKKFPRGTHLACQRSFNNSNAYECPSAAETFWLWRTVKGPGGFFRF